MEAPQGGQIHSPRQNICRRDEHSAIVCRRINRNQSQARNWVTGAGGFGHIGIAVDSDNTEGFSTLDPTIGKLRRLYSRPPGGVENDIRAHTSITTRLVAPHAPICITVSAEQAKVMKLVIARRTVDPGTYNLFLNNCARFVEDVLRAGEIGGVPHAEIFGPAILGGILWFEGLFRRK